MNVLQDLNARTKVLEANMAIVMNRDNEMYLNVIKAISNLAKEIERLVKNTESMDKRMDKLGTLTEKALGMREDVNVSDILSAVKPSKRKNK